MKSAPSRSPYGRWIATCLALLAAPGPAFGQETPEPVDSATMQKLVTADNAFGVRVLREACHRNPDRNVLLSPPALAMGLGMTLHDAGGAAAQALATTLGVEGWNADDLDRASSALRASLEEPSPDVQLTLDNSIWSRKGIEFKPEFASRVQTFYEAVAGKLDFTDVAGATALINNAVRLRTNRRVELTLDAVEPGTAMLAVSALYFRGDWAIGFDPAKTKETDFAVPGSKPVRVSMMFQSAKWPYWRGPDFQAVRLRYAGDHFAMYVFLPDENASLDRFIDGMSVESVANWTQRMTPASGALLVPRLSVSAGADLGPVLARLGLQPALQPKADFTGACSGCALSHVQSRVVLETDEHGPVPALSHNLAWGNRGAASFTFIADRPFFALVRDERTGALVCLARIVSP